MTSSNSPEAVADPASSSAAAPYGTRSRGRNAPRPNYAETYAAIAFGSFGGGILNLHINVTVLSIVGPRSVAAS